MSATDGAAITGGSRNRNRHLSENRFYSPPPLQKHREKQEQQRSSLSRTSSENRPGLGPLFNLLSKVFSEECMNEFFIPVRRLSQPSNPSEGNNSTIYHIQQTLLIILEDIIISLKTIPLLNEKIKTKINIKLLIECAQNSNVVITRNHVFFVLSAITRAFPDEVLEYTLDILVVIGEATVTQEDVLERAKRAKEKAAREVIEARGLISKSTVETTAADSGNSKTSNSAIDPVTSIQFTDAPETDTKPSNEEKPSISSTSGE